MEYRVLSRKWRPQIFKDVIGQDHVVKTLTNAIRQNRIAHAFIFSGPRGVGKTSIARIMAKALNCENGPTEVPCDLCTNCREITEGISIDVHEIDGASNRGIDEMRELRENVKFSPVSSRYKVYIIDEVHMLTREAFNALLKTLEEPPSHVIFIFATTETHKIPSTILSRCQCFDFKRISLRQISENLRMICESEHINISDTGLMWIAEAGDGSARDAQSILDQVISYADNDITDDDIRDLLGLKDRRFLFIFSEAVLERDAAKCLKAVEDGYYAGVDMKYFYQMLLNHFRNLLLLKILGDHHVLLELTGDELISMKEQIKNCSRETLQQYLDILMAEEENIRKSPNPRFNLEAILVKMVYLEPILPIDQILLRIEGLERKLLEKPGTPSRKFRAEVEETLDRKVQIEKQNNGLREQFATYSDKSPNDIYGINSNQDDYQTSIISPAINKESFIKEFISFVKTHNPPLSSKIEPGKLGYEDGCLKIVFPKGYIFFDDINDKVQKARLVEIAKAFFKKDITLQIESIDPEDKENGGKKNPENQKINEIKREALQSPLLQKVLDVFANSEVREVIHRKNSQNEIEK